MTLMLTETHRQTALAIPLLCGSLLLGAAGSSCTSTELAELREENQRLRTELEDLRSRLAGSGPELPPFTIGLAASGKDFPEQDFLGLLRDSLESASGPGEGSFEVTLENDEQQVAKLRGMLIRQHLAEGRVPVVIHDLTYKLHDPDASFTIGGADVPRDGLLAERLGEDWIRFTHAGPLHGVIEQDRGGLFALPYEASDGTRGTLRLELGEGDLFSPGEEPRFERQGDLSLGWKPALETVRAYRVRGFSGDMGTFMHHMRYPRRPSALNRYQTLRDSALLFAYGPYPTGLIQRMETPVYIDRVEVMPITAELFEALEPGLPEPQLAELLASAEAGWVDCELADEAAGKRSWNRPVDVEVPFLSRQTSDAKGLVFYTKYDRDGPLLVRDYELRGK